MRLLPIAAAVAAALLASAVSAGEGMWVPQQLPEIASPLKDAGLELAPEQLADLTADPMGAVVALGGCTASFVSPNGLVATNHHCAYGAIQLNSTPEKNLMALGFNAATTADEVSAGPTARVFVMDRISDVSAVTHAALASATDGLARQKALEAKQKSLIAECEKEAGYRCTLYSFFGGQTFRLFRQIEIKDVRLAYAPPSSIGNYGGEIDNWMWPRHTGDFTFYRAYVGPDGKPAAFSKDNLPYRPKHWLKLADQPLGAGDFVMVAGYPGQTNRYALVDELAGVVEWQYPVVGQHLKNVVALVQRAGKDDKDIQVKYAATIRGWQNSMKNWDGQLEGFKRVDALAGKQSDEQAVLDWLRAGAPGGEGLSAAARLAAIAAHQQLEALAADARETRERDLVMGQIGNLGLFGSVRQIYRLAVEKPKPDLERAPGFQQRDLSNIEGSQRQLERRYVRSMETQLMAYWLCHYARLPAAQRLSALDAIVGDGSEAAIQRGLDSLYAGTSLEATDARVALLGAEQATLDANADPLLKLAAALHPTYLTLENEVKSRSGDSLLHRPAFLAAVQAYRKSRGNHVYPDANLSLRITFGNVMGYTPRDGVAYTPFTTLEGLAAKATDSEPFAAPQGQLDAIRDQRHGKYAAAELGSVPVNFMADLDITGGNSGSPVMDARGRLVGLAFDMNWESVSSNWVFDPKMTLAIAVDSRYMMWVMEHAYPAPQFVKELEEAAKAR